MDICNNLDKSVTELQHLDRDSLIRVIENAEKLLSKAKEQLVIYNKPSPGLPAIVDNIEQSENILTDSLYNDVIKHLKSLHYTPTGAFQPDVYLYGDSPYTYSRATQNLKHVSVLSSPLMSQVLNIVNTKQGTNYNSILVNRYSNKNAFLDWHKDDEEEIDDSVPISSLSLGVVRRFQITDCKTKTNRTQFKNFMLKPNSLFCMQPVIQRSFFHQLAKGRASHQSECGVRFSLTFRRIISKTSASVHTPVPVPISTPIMTAPKSPAKISKPGGSKVCDAVVFGSSLAKGLNKDLLSDRGKESGRYFEVFSHRGAGVRTITNDMKNIHNDGLLKMEEVKNVFFICGGNDVENCYPDSDIDKVMLAYNELINLATEYFPNARINMFSLIPRRAAYANHIDRMHLVNYLLSQMCDKFANTKFINIFTHFLDVKTGHDTMLSYLYARDMLHFTDIGYSVLAKVLIGVVYRPR